MVEQKVETSLNMGICKSKSATDAVDQSSVKITIKKDEFRDHLTLEKKGSRKSTLFFHHLLFHLLFEERPLGGIGLAVGAAEGVERREVLAGGRGEEVAHVLGLVAALD